MKDLLACDTPQPGVVGSFNRDLPHPACEVLPLPQATLQYYPAFLTPTSSAELLQQLLRQTPWRQDELRFGGKAVPVPRLQAWYGDSNSRYGYSGLRLPPLAWTPPLAALRQHLEDVLQLPFNSVLLNCYRDGNDSVAWHSDNERELGPDPKIASLSLGAARLFELKHRSERRHGKRSMYLEDGSLLLMGSGLQQHWLHQLPKAPGLGALRLNLTFRFIHTMA